MQNGPESCTAMADPIFSCYTAWNTMEEMMDNHLPGGYTSRPARLDDVEATVAMMNADAKQLVGIEKFVVEDTRAEWQTPGFNLEQDTHLVLDQKGQVVAYYEVWDPDPPHVNIYVWGRVHPEHTGKGIGTYLMNWAEERARLSLPKSPPEARVIMTGFAISLNGTSRELFLAEGFELVRHSLRMVIRLDEAPEEPVWPEGITVRRMIPGQDERAVIQAVRESFKDHYGYVEHPFEDEYQRLLHQVETDPNFDPNLWFLAVDGDQVVGTSLCRGKTNDDPEMGWVGTLGVIRPWRRRGLGLALLRHSFGEFYRRGIHKVGLGVDAQSLTGATDLYLKAGMQPDPARQFDLFEKELRPGVDITTKSVEVEAAG
jgi:mycothiol synthase